MPMGDTPTCRTCGETIDGGFAAMMAHYKTAHPGQKSEARAKKRSQEKGAPASSPSDPAGEEASPAASPAGPPNPLLEELPPDLGPDAIAPTPPKRTWKERLWSGKPRDVPRETSRAKKPAGRRANTSELLGGAWGLLGAGLIRTGADVPVGRCLQYQAPIAGDVLDKLVAGSFIDRAVLQPIAKRTDDAEIVGALLGLPVLIFLYERATDEMKLVLEPIMVEAFRAHLTAMVPVIRKKQARQRELDKVVEDLKADGMLPPETAGVDDAIRQVFGAIFTQPEEPPDPNTNGNASAYATA